VWYPLCALLPAALALGAAAGYVITAITVVENIARSYWVILLLAVGISALGRIGGAALDRFDLAGQLEAREEARFEDQLRSFGRLLLAFVTVAGLAWAWNDLIPAFGIVSNMAVWTVAAGALLGLLVALTSVGAGALGTVLLLVHTPCGGSGWRARDRCLGRQWGS
jgi:peptidoglycan biosynthesis protein MviN/MurJ (putative lipid II flippase)